MLCQSLNVFCLWLSDCWFSYYYTSVLRDATTIYTFYWYVWLCSIVRISGLPCQGCLQLLSFIIEPRFIQTCAMQRLHICFSAGSLQFLYARVLLVLRTQEGHWLIDSRAALLLNCLLSNWRWFLWDVWNSLIFFCWRSSRAQASWIACNNHRH